MRFVKPYMKLFIIGPLFKFFEAVLEILLPFMMAKVIDNGVATGDTDYIYKVGGLMILAAFVGLGCALVCQYSASKASQGIGTDMRNDLFKHILYLSNASHGQIGTSSLVNRITSDVNLIQQGVAMLIRLVVRAPFLCIGGLVLCYSIDAMLATIILIVVVLFIVFQIVVMLKVVPMYKKVQSKLDRISQVVRENLEGIRVIRAFTREKYEENRFSEVNSGYYKEAIVAGRISAMVNPLTTLMVNFGIAAIVWYGGIGVNDGRLSTGSVIAFISYVSQILAALIVISNLVTLYTKVFAANARIKEVYNIPVIDIEASNISEEQKNMVQYQNVPAVEFRNVSMTYEPDSEYDLENVSLVVNRGETVGIVGGTGSGKSTLVNMIYRSYDANEGQVLVDGIDVRDYSLKELREKIGLVPQKTVLFSGTIADNIRWGKENATDEEVVMAAKVAMASEFIEKMPDGYNTMITRGGTNVSGGQRQRLTIARAVVRRPEIMILDDSFSALDFLTDANLRKALAQTCQGMTTFIVSQRISTIRNADKIIVMNDGRIEAIGKHEQLYATSEVYREIYDSQNKDSKAEYTQNNAGVQAGIEYAQNNAGVQAGVEYAQNNAGMQAGVEYAQNNAGMQAGVEYAQNNAGMQPGVEYAQNNAGMQAGINIPQNGMNTQNGGGIYE